MISFSYSQREDKGAIPTVVFQAILLSLLLTFATPAILFAEDGARASAQKPIIVLVEQSIWLMVIGSDTPTFALYSDGLTVFLQRSEGRVSEYASTMFNEEQQKKFVDSLPIGDDFNVLEDEYVLTEWTDQPTNVLWVWSEGHAKKVSVYGDLRGNEEVRLKAPATFLSLFDELTSFEGEQVQVWLPESIEVMVWPYEHSPVEPLAWPAGWPGTTHPDTRKRGEDSYSILLDSARFNNLKGLLRQRGEKQAVLIDGKKWTVSYRLPFPSEGLWME